MVFSLGKNRGLPMTEENPEGRSIPNDGLIAFRPFLRCYTNFLLMNPSVYERDMKRIIRKIDDVLMFLKIHSGAAGDILEPLLYGFLLSHRCENRGCKKFTYLKCQECRADHYCG